MPEENFMRYKRRFKLQASHFNGDWCYKRVWADKINPDDVTQLLSKIHGHNFRIDVALDGALGVQWESWLVDDVELNRTVMAWDNINLSMHPDFIVSKLRATTENMAQVLFTKLTRQFGQVVKSVTVYETDEIYATAGG